MLQEKFQSKMARKTWVAPQIMSPGDLVAISVRVRRLCDPHSDETG